MPHSISDEAHGGACIRSWGDVTGAEIIGVVRRGQALPSFTDRRYTIHDFTGIERFSCSPQDVEGLAATDSGAALTNRRLQVRVVTTRPDVERRVRAYQTVGVPVFPVQVFPSMQEARAWRAAARPWRASSSARSTRPAGVRGLRVRASRCGLGRPAGRAPADRTIRLRSHRGHLRPLA